MNTLVLNTRIIFFTLLISCSLSVSADAIVRTQAMLASTIAEYFIEDKRVYVELEIGLQDLDAFVNLLPDEIYAKTGKPPKPFEQRTREFFEREFVVAAEDRKPIRGRILKIGPRPRIKRDNISGEPLPSTDKNKEVVVFVEIEFPLSHKPKTLTIGKSGGGRASVGFVVYHHNVPVNDFRYLGPVQVLELDWEDPWYTTFTTRNLRRTYNAAMSGFIYVEPYEVRKEIIVRPKDMQYWLDLGLEGRNTIPVAMQDDIKRKIAEFLRTRQVVKIDGKKIKPELARVNFLERTLTSSRVIDPPMELGVYSAVLGIIFVYPTDGLPKNVTMEWDLFNERIKTIRAASVDQAGPLPILLEPDFRILEWQNFLKKPKLPTLTTLSTPPPSWQSWLLNLRWVFLAGFIGCLLWCLYVRKTETGGKTVKVSAVVCLLLLMLSIGFSWNVRWSNDSARIVVAGLLHNIYRAFDFRKEKQIYDTLEQSVVGELLAEIYLETQKGLELANQGGARAKVKEVDLTEFEAIPASDGGFDANVTWKVSGSVGHWGHVHTRRNQYQAKLNIVPVQGNWKLKSLEILQEERL